MQTMQQDITFFVEIPPPLTDSGSWQVSELDGKHEIRARVTAAEQRLLSRAHITPEMVDLSRNLTERDDQDHHGEWRGTIPQQQVRVPCGVCGRPLEDDQKFIFGGWLVHRTSAVESAAGTDGRGDDRFGVAIRDGTGAPRRRTFRLTAIVLRIHMRYDRTTPDGAHQQRQLEPSWRSLTSGVEEAASQGEGSQDVERGLEESEKFWCSYYGWRLNISRGESGEDDARVPVPCAHGRFIMHTRCMLNHAENLARGHADSRPCVACRSAWPGGSRPPHPAELARGISMDRHEGRWGAVRGALQFATRVQRHIPDWSQPAT